ncbi:hypothetical protein [Chitinilyticum litopenaei]|uniref:hypothetical protein n=1 Tax=Chitinilyticum litopenaei TaxID=1121276 RepID=UPI00048CA3AF|nr:hypothetical protein [Chitinilyticum litopenaei]
MKLKLLTLSLPALLLANAHAAEPQATPPQCLLAAQGGTAVPDKNGDFDLEKCLSKAGSPNFSRKGKTLTVFLANGKKAVFKNSKSEEGDSVYTYAGFDPATGLHQVSFFEDNPEWPSVGYTLLDPNAGQLGHVYGQLPAHAVSPDRQWVVSSRNCGMDSCSITDSIAISRLPARGMRGEVKDSELIIPADVPEEQRGQGNGDVTIVGVAWLSPQQAQLEISCRNSTSGKLHKDQVSLSQSGERWALERTPCVTVASAGKGKQAVADTSRSTGSLRAGMSLDEVEKLFGRAADGFKINPLALLGKKEITRVWKGRNGQVEVVFVGDVVSSWR